MQNLHYSKHGTENWIVTAAETQILTNVAHFEWIAYDHKEKTFVRFNYERRIDKRQPIALKGSFLFKEEN